MIDVGMSAAYGGPAACLVIEDGRFFSLTNGEMNEIPVQKDPLQKQQSQILVPGRLRRPAGNLADNSFAFFAVLDAPYGKPHPFGAQFVEKSIKFVGGNR